MSSVAAMANSTSSHSRFSFDLFTAILAATPVIFALTTWDHDQANNLQLVMRQLSFPVIAVEFATIAIAARAGMSIKMVLSKIPSWLRVALSVIAAIVISTEFLLPDSTAYSLERTIFYFIHVGFGLSAHFLISNHRERLSWFWPPIAAGLAAYSVCLALFVFNIPNEAKFNWRDVGLAVTHVRHLGVYSLVATAVAWGLLAQEKQAGRGWYFAIACVGIAISFWSGTRGSLLALVVTMIIALIAFKSTRKLPWVAMVSGSLLIGALLSTVHQAPKEYYGIQRIIGATADTSGGIQKYSSRRSEIWLDSAMTIFEHPIFGIGESRFRLRVKAANGFYNHPHNFVLQYALQWGIPTAAALAGIFTWLTFLGYRRAQCSEGLGLPAAFTIIGLTALATIDGAFYYPYPLAMLAISFGYLLALPGPTIQNQAAI